MRNRLGRGRGHERVSDRGRPKPLTLLISSGLLLGVQKGEGPTGSSSRTRAPEYLGPDKTFSWVNKEDPTGSG